MKRSRAPEAVRADALAMGSKKTAAGCDGCAESYFALARQHGATDEDIACARASGLSQRAARGLTRGALLKSAVVGAAGAVSRAAIEGVRPGEAHAAGAPATTTTVVSDQAMQPLMGAALANPQTRMLRAYIEQRGFGLSAPHSRGFVRSDGARGLVLIFAAPGRKDFGLIAWGRSPAGREMVQGDLVHYLRDSGPTTSLAAARQYIKPTGLAVIDGQIAVVDDYWTCWWDHVIFCCGPAAIGCIWAAGAYLVCLLAICDFCVFAADFWCYFHSS